MGSGWELNKPNCCPLTCIAAAPHLHLGIIDSEHPAPGDTHICRHLHVSDVIGAGSRDVEVALSITGVKTCLGGQGQRAERHQHGEGSGGGRGKGHGSTRGGSAGPHVTATTQVPWVPPASPPSGVIPQDNRSPSSPSGAQGGCSQHPLASPARRCGVRGTFLPLKLLLLSGSRWRAAHWPRCAVAALFTSIKPALLNSGIQNASPSSTPAISCRQAGREPRTDQLVVNSHIQMGTGLHFFFPPS